MLEKVLLPIDGSEHSMRAVETVKELSHVGGGEVIVLHLREREISRAGAYDLETPDEATDLVDRVVRDLKDAGVSARGEVRTTMFGNAAREILAQAEAERVGLIVMGSRGLSDFGALLLGSVTHKVIHLAGCPVLVVR